MYCNRCGTDLPKKAAHCPRCGIAITNQAHKSKPNAINIIMVSCFAIAIVLALFLLFRILPTDVMLFFVFCICALLFVGGQILFWVRHIKKDSKAGPSIATLVGLVGAIVTIVLLPTSEPSEPPVAEAFSNMELSSSAAEIAFADDDASDQYEVAIVEPPQDEDSSSEELASQSEHRTGDDIVGVSDKNIDDVLSSIGINNVKNDVTGNWRYATIAKNIQVEEYAASYYNKYFTDNNEIHFIINFNYQTTTKISYLGTILSVTVCEYVDKEEHNAKTLLSGMLLNDYLVYMDNGDIERIV